MSHWVAQYGMAITVSAIVIFLFVWALVATFIADDARRDLHDLQMYLESWDEDNDV